MIGFIFFTVFSLINLDVDVGINGDALVLYTTGESEKSVVFFVS